MDKQSGQAWVFASLHQQMETRRLQIASNKM
jgi:hypothetical protein